jgi:hypothetical protein
MPECHSVAADGDSQAVVTVRKEIMSNLFSTICYVMIELPGKLWRAIFGRELLSTWWYSHYR